MRPALNSSPFAFAFLLFAAAVQILLWRTYWSPRCLFPPVSDAVKFGQHARSVAEIASNGGSRGIWLRKTPGINVVVAGGKLIERVQNNRDEGCWPNPRCLLCPFRFEGSTAGCSRCYGQKVSLERVQRSKSKKGKGSYANRYLAGATEIIQATAARWLRWPRRWLARPMKSKPRCRRDLRRFFPREASTGKKPSGSSAARWPRTGSCRPGSATLG